MKFPNDEHLGIARSSDGKEIYDLEFYGQNEGRAVAEGPLTLGGGGRMVEVPEVYEARANDAEEARRVLAAWAKENGYTAEFNQI